jgi:hypothetical protein
MKSKTANHRKVWILAVSINILGQALASNQTEMTIIHYP